MGDPLAYGGTNYIGLSRKGFSNEVILEIKRAYKIIYRSNMNISEALDEIEKTLKPLDEIKHIVNFVKRCERGLIRG